MAQVKEFSVEEKLASLVTLQKIESKQLEGKIGEKHMKDSKEEIAEKAVALDKAKKALGAKEGVLTTKKGELEKNIAATEKEEKHFNKMAAEAREHVDDRLLTS